MIKNIEKSNENVAINDKEIAVLREHFPACFKSDGSFDIERFKETLKDKVDVVHEGYELKFLGKSYAKLLASLDTTTVITPNEEHNSQPENENSENIYISGDNLDGLKHLLKSYAKSVKCIYIDPPYNTGSDGFVYKDNFNFTAEELQDKLSVDENQANRILELTQKGSASHSAWLMFMYSRLQLAKDLLKDDGVIFISIDDNEQANLKLLCDDIFGEESFVATIPWRKRTAKSDVSFGVSQDYESIVCYAKKNFIASMKGGSRKYYETDDLINRPWRIHDMTTQRNADERPNSNFTIVNPKNGDEYPVNPNAVWRVTTETIKDYIKENRIVYPGDYDFLNISKPVLRYFKDDDEKKAGEMFGFLPVSTNLPKEIGMSQDGTKDIAKLFETKVFNYPKPISLLKYLIKMATNHEDECIVVDFFSGSGSSSQAVIELNSEVDNLAKRKFISIQLPESLDKKNVSQKTAFEFLESNNLPTTLDYIGIERIKRAAKKIKEETKAEIDYGFKHFILNEPNPNTLDKCETFDKVNLIGDGSILEDFGVDTVLTTWLNYDGYGLTTKATELDLNGYKAYYHQKHLYLIHTDFTQDAVMDLFEKYDTIPHFNPENIVLFGYSFYEWSVTEMLEMNLKILNDTEKNLKINIEVRY
ncbi:site-specific DNA-methyltransferase [Flavobacterium sp.]|uniref:site-specific DNA-methyltransferase n=1 Tax=Flavobacterium sp. TaxID=239 RepID=UPI0040476345